MNNKYKNGKIYCIWSYETDDIYIGSSCNELDHRMKKHKDNYKSFLNGVGHYKCSFDIIKYGDAEIGIIEEFPCQSKYELLRREGELQKSLPCINKKIAGRSKKEWYEENKEKMTEYHKKYRENNREKIAIKDKLKYENNKEHIAKRAKIYNQKNKEPLARMKKLYYEKNKEKIDKYRKEKFDCQCGITYTYSNKSRHLKTITHQKYLEQQQQEL